MTVAERLHVGGVWINEASTFRQQNAPYGGVGDSGLGREGIRAASVAAALDLLLDVIGSG